MSAAAIAVRASSTIQRFRPWVGYAGFAWALTYIPIHIYWAVGGSTSAIGVSSPDEGFRVANWGASVVILGAGLTSLALVQRWGLVVPAGLRRGAAWVGAGFALLHFVAFSVASALRLSGVVAYRDDADVTVAQMHSYDVANLLYFEPWFGLMGVLLVAALHQDRLRATAADAEGDAQALPVWIQRARWARPMSIALLGVLAAGHLAWAYGIDVAIPARADTPRLVELAEFGGYRPIAAAAAVLLAVLAGNLVDGRRAAWRRGGTALTLAGLLLIVWGVFTFDVWSFAGHGPALTAVGLLTLVAYATSWRAGE